LSLSSSSSSSSHLPHFIHALCCRSQVTFYVNGHKWVTLIGVANDGEGSSKGPWFFYISIKNYAVPAHIPNSKTEQVYRIVPHPPLRTTEYSLASSSSSPVKE
jgi:hypothetical protein